jgi:hypothetical protein
MFHFKDGFAPVRNDGQGVPIASSTRFGLGDYGRPDPTDPQNRPHAGFQDVLTAIRETQPWSKVLIIAEDDTSLPSCFDEAKLAVEGLRDLAYPYSVDYEDQFKKPSPQENTGGSTNTNTNTTPSTDSGSSSQNSQPAGGTSSGATAPQGGGTTGSSIPDRVIDARLRRVKLLRTKGGRRQVVAKVATREPVTATAVVTRKGKVLKRLTAHLAAGDDTLRLTLPSGTRLKSARLTIRLVDGAGNTKLIRRSLGLG